MLAIPFYDRIYFTNTTENNSMNIVTQHTILHSIHFPEQKAHLILRLISII